MVVSQFVIFIICSSRASGHVDRFTDYMVKDVKTGECYRADHLLKGLYQEAGKPGKCEMEQFTCPELFLFALFFAEISFSYVTLSALVY